MEDSEALTQNGLMNLLFFTQVNKTSLKFDSEVAVVMMINTILSLCACE